MSHQSSPPPHDLPERRRGGLVGLLVGDALGVPYEFTPAAGVPQRSAIEMTPPPGFARAHGRVEPGTWSDDGAQALVLLDSLLRLGRLDADDLADGIRRWYREGFCAVGGVVFDVGIQTSAAIRRHESGTPAPQAGPAGERDNGNGSLMRVLPLALWHTGSDAGLVADARTQSSVTHGHVRSQLCCALYCLWARRLLSGTDATPAWDDAVAALHALVEPAAWADLDEHVLARVGEAPRGTGYVVDSLLATRHLLAAERDYEGVVKAAIALGDDTDTTAAIAGGLAGIRSGESGIPDRWRSALRGREILDPLLDGLVALPAG